MSAPVRFLVVAVAGWARFRGVTAGMLPGAEVLALSKAEAASTPLPAVIATEFPPIAPMQGPPQPAPAYAYAAYPPYPPYAPYPAYAGYAPPPQPRYAPPAVYYYPAYPSQPPVSVAAQAAPQPADASPEFFAPLPRIEDADFAQISPQSTPDWNGRPTGPARGVLAKILPAKYLDRLQFSAWALMRGTPGTGSLASGGTLGGSQAGGRLTYAFNRQIAASLRSSSPIGSGRGGEVAAGVRFTPFPSIPVAITAERRQAIGKFSTGRNDFALFAEGGLYQRPLGWNMLLDGYAQAGVVGIRERDFFADGGFAVTRPVWGRFSAGLGAWGGYQPGLYRVDAGPRLSMRVRPNVSLHLDYRQRLAGAAAPGSGPALTLGANF